MVGPNGVSTSTTGGGLAISSGGTFYGTPTASRFGTYNSGSGAYTDIGNPAKPNGGGYGALDFDGGVLYGINVGLRLTAADIARDNQPCDSGRNECWCIHCIVGCDCVPSTGASRILTGSDWTRGRFRNASTLSGELQNILNSKGRLLMWSPFFCLEAESWTLRCAQSDSGATLGSALGVRIGLSQQLL